jgi:hypothetical protein
LSKNYIFALLFALLLSGCVKTQCYDRNGLEYEPEDIVPSLNLQSTFSEIALELCECQDGVCPGKSVLVTDTVDISTLKSDEAGFFMTDMLKSSLNQVCNYQITEAKFSEYFELSKSGFVALTSRAKDIKPIDRPVSTAVVSSYKYSNSSLFVFVREINTFNGKIEKFVTKEVPFNCIGDTIFRTDFK